MPAFAVLIAVILFISYWLTFALFVRGTRTPTTNPVAPPRVIWEPPLEDENVVAWGPYNEPHAVPSWDVLNWSATSVPAGRSSDQLQRLMTFVVSVVS